jgi:hypothetical protein
VFSYEVCLAMLGEVSAKLLPELLPANLYYHDYEDFILNYVISALILVQKINLFSYN